jgi:hypothetical protein
MSLPIDPAVSFPPVDLKSSTDTTAHYRTFSSLLFHRTGTKAIDSSGVVRVYNLRFSASPALAEV